MDKAAGTGWEAEGARAAKRGQAAGLYITAAVGPDIAHREEIRGLRALRKGNGPTLTAVCFQHPQAKREPTPLPAVTFILQRQRVALSLGLQRGPGRNGKGVFESCHKIELW